MKFAGVIIVRKGSVNSCHMYQAAGIIFGTQFNRYRSQALFADNRKCSFIRVLLCSDRSKSCIKRRESTRLNSMYFQRMEKRQRFEQLRSAYMTGHTARWDIELKREAVISPCLILSFRMWANLAWKSVTGSLEGHVRDSNLTFGVGDRPLCRTSPSNVTF